MPTNANQACTVSRQATGDTTNLPNIQYAARFQRNSGQTGTGNLNPSYNLETADSIPFAGKTITFSFYARKGANYSASSSLLSARLITGTGTDQNLQNGYTGQAQIGFTDATLTTTWQRFTITATVGSTATQLGFYFAWIPTGTAGAADFFEITGIMINVGSTALPYRRNSATIQGELAACQRYYWRGSAAENFAVYGTGSASSTTAVEIFVPILQTMRVKPTSVDYASLFLSDGAASPAISSITIAAYTTNAVRLNTVTTGVTQYRFYSLMNAGTSAGYVAFNAEL
jgi:hypothetical protein